jgi:PTS system mannitol-specific IIA component
MTRLLQPAGIVLDATASSREEAVALCGQQLMALGAISPEYAAAMWEREQKFSSAIGEGFAIPHGTDESRQYVAFDQLVFIRLAEELDWPGEPVRVLVGIASRGDGHVEVLGNLAELIMDDEKAEQLRTSADKDLILKLLTDL